MPNTPSLVETGASVFSSGSNALPEDSTLVKTLLASVGIVEEIPEKLMDVATGSSDRYSYWKVCVRMSES